MRRLHKTVQIMAIGTMLSSLGDAAWLVGQQTVNPNPSAAQTTQSGSENQSKAPATPTAHKNAAHRKARRMQTIPIETASPSSTKPQLSPTQQRAADQKLLNEQQNQSDRDAQINDSLVKKAQRREDQQSIPRIEDGPQDRPNGTPAPAVQPYATQPASVTPSTGSPENSRIQDAPSNTTAPTQPQQPVSPAQPTNPPQF